MTSELVDILLGGTLALFASALLCSWLTPALLRTVVIHPLSLQERTLWWWVTMPLYVGLGSGLWVANPDWLAFWFEPHCHGSMCDVHAPDLIDSSSSATASLIIILLLLAIALGWRLWQLQGRRRQQRMMQQLSTLDNQRGVHIVPSAQPLAWCAGLWRPVIYLSQGLIDSLSEHQRQLVLIHEQSHRWRRDNLRRWSQQLLLWCWLPFARKQLTGHYHQLTELSADGLVLQQGYTIKELAEVRKRMESCDQQSAQSDLVAQPDKRPAPTDTWITSLQLTFLLVLLAVVQISVFSLLLHPLLDYLFVY